MKQKTIADIKHMLEHPDNSTQDLIQRLQHDERKGVQKLIAAYEKRCIAHDRLNARFDQMCQFELDCFANGYQYVAGVDEAGRGPLAGPVVAGAVILPRDFRLIGLNDSKQLNAAKRDEYYHIITEKALSYGVSAVPNHKIDQINIYEATKMAMKQAIAQLEPKPDYVLIDAVSLSDLPYPSEPLVKGDCKSISIAAASVLAKVTRDRIMNQLHNEYPDYQFASNMGYGTKHHLDMLKEKGATPYHRKSFQPVTNLYTSV